MAPSKTQKVLLVDDDESLRRVIEFQLQEAGYQVDTAEGGEQALKSLMDDDFDCLITDWRMPGMSGVELLRGAVAVHSELPVIVITAFSDVDTAVEALRNGAFDFITKPFNRQMILLTVERALKFGRTLSENRRLRRLIHDEFTLENVVGSSKRMKELFDVVERVAKTDATVLLEGESGTGKELIAKGIHVSGVRSDGPFVAINCAAIPETLIEAELFGYKKGAFTGASSESRGKFEVANGGTIFLDEIGAMPLQGQPRLLRVLQEQEITRLGENTVRKVDVRVIAATHENLRERAVAGEFREDLYYRLAVVPIRLPPLRERRDDIPLLIDHFLAKTAEKHRLQLPKLDRDALNVLYDYSWPGNVRELENTIERMVVLSTANVLSLIDVPPWIKDRKDVNPSNSLWFSLPDEAFDLERLEVEIIRNALSRFEGNQSQTARYLGLTRSSLIYRIQKYGL